MWSKMFPEVWDTILAPLRGFAIPYPRHPRLAPWAAFCGRLRRFCVRRLRARVMTATEDQSKENETQYRSRVQGELLGLQMVYFAGAVSSIFTLENTAVSKVVATCEQTPRPT